MSEFISNPNKALIWNLLLQSGAFQNIQESNYDIVKQMLDNIMTSEDKENKTIIEKNKSVLIKISQNLKKLQKEAITSQDITEMREKQLSNKLEKKELEFKNLMTIKPPDQIDFKDNLDDKPLGDNLNSIINDMVQKREQELNYAMTTHDQAAASEWLKPNVEETKKIPITSKSQTRLVPIKEEEEPNILNLIKLKKPIQKEDIIEDVIKSLNKVKEEIKFIENNLQKLND